MFVVFWILLFYIPLFIFLFPIALVIYLKRKFSGEKGKDVSRMRNLAFLLLLGMIILLILGYLAYNGPSKLGFD